MFTGIVEEIGTIHSVQRGKQSAVLKIGASQIVEGLKNGDSVNTNGACLTVISVDGDSFSADVMAETMRLTNLQFLKPGSKVNLERAMKLNERLGGHLVSGHIDGTGTITGIAEEDNAQWITVSADPAILRYMIKKGSIAIDGISLTVAKLTGNDFSVSLIPYTIKDTTLAHRKKGEMVNLECDMVGKYIERFMNAGTESKQRTIDLDYLKEHGFI
jgi:riboflavin synthase